MAHPLDRLHGRNVTVDNGDGQPAAPRSVSLAGLATVGVVLAALALVTVGAWAWWGWPAGLVALGLSLLYAERYGER